MQVDADDYWYQQRLDDAQFETDSRRARELFADRSTYVEGVGRVGPAVHADAVALLKEDPDEYFRLSRIWQSIR